DDSWIESGPIGDLEDSKIRIKKWVTPDGQPAETKFSVLERHEDIAALLLAEPKTGRTNQIRIHAAFAGHPLFGDRLYHPDEAVFIESFESGDTPRVLSAIGFSRLCLHAAGVEFRHPRSGKLIEISIPLPDELKAFWDSGCR